MASPMRICIALDSRTTGGIETHVLHQASALHQAGLQVVVVFIKDRGGHPLCAAFEQRGIETRFLDGRLRSLRHFIRAWRADLVHGHGYRASIMGRLATLGSSTGMFSTFHAGDRHRGKLGLYDWLDRYTAFLNRHSFCVSSEIARRLPVAATVLDNFIDLPPLPPTRGQRIAFVGRLSHEKGPDRLLQIAESLGGVPIHVYGAGPMEQGLRDTGADGLVLHGNQASMDEHWRDIGVLLIPSRQEGLPMAALEAMARRIPVIAFDVGALGKLIESGRNGWLVEPDDLPAFIERVRHWLSSSESHKALMGNLARSRVERRFGARNVLPRLLDHYHKHCGGKGSIRIANCKADIKSTN